DWARAADLWRRSTGLIIRRVQRGTNNPGSSRGQPLTGKRKGEAEQSSHQFRGLVRTVHRLASEARGANADLSGKAFQAAQGAQSSEAAASLAQMAARQAKGDNTLARLARERQDLVGEWQTRDKMLIAAKSQSPDKRHAAAETALAARL